VTVLLLVRHGSTDALGKLISGRAPGVPLNAAGRVEVDRLAARLGRTAVGAVYSSPIERCVETANALAAPHALGVTLRENLTEIDFGEWTGLSLAELERLPAFREFNLARSRARPPGGEHAAEVQARMVEELERIRHDHPNAIVVVVSHGDPLKTALGYYLGLPVDLLSRLEILPASLSALRLTLEQAVLLSFNDTGDSARSF
jgi:probable phosphoglycerate mutase